MSKEPPTNTIKERAIWLGSYGRSAAPLFAKIDAPLPLDDIRYGVGGLKTGFRGKNLSVVYPPKHSAAGRYEVTLSLGVAEKKFAGREMLRCLVKIAADFNGLNELEVARNLGFRGTKRDLVMSTGLSDKNDDLCEALGDYPHAMFSLPGMSIDEAMRPIGAPPKQQGRLHKLVCVGGTPGKKCGFDGVRMAENSPGRAFIACAFHGATTLRIWVKDTPDPRDEQQPPMQDAAD